MLRKTFLTLAFMTTLCHPAWAQSSVTMRAGAHSGYTRAVFDWPQAVPYTVKENGPDALTVSFSSQAALVMGETEYGAGLQKAEQVSGAGQDLAVKLSITPGSTYRHFLIGNRVVVDIFDPSGKTKTASAAKKTPAPKAEKVKEEPAAPKATGAPVPVKKTANEGPPVKAVKTEKVESEEVAQAVPAPQPSILEQAAPALAPHVVTLSTTSSVGLAAFIRGDELWMVMDRADLNVPPQIAGDQADKFGEFKRVEVKGGVAYRAKLPPESKASHFYGEGGGLVWRVVITPNRRETKPVAMKREYKQDNTARGASVSWPMKTAVRELDVADPSVGDVIKVVTVQQADDFTGEERDMVDFNVLDSMIGLALVPRTDDLEIDVGKDGVKLERPVGLAVSSQDDVSRSRMRENIGNADMLTGAEQPGEPMKRIFDFDRWMMGGLQALEQNQRILLANMGPKDKADRVQDLLTLAKMNVSNDRGQEAVGFLAFAGDELPDLEDSPEFHALRGASAALAGKYQMAFKDLFIPSLKDYSELDYWRAFTLAGLEDWQQAIATMPKDYSVLVSYPRPLLEKIGVKLAEVALRAGDTNAAESILATLEKEKATLKPWTLAAIDYLKGEARRQTGDLDGAEKLWKPMVTGSDDFYRAKAGLALTMLQLQRGDIDVDKVIDRLEGMRYAWRGDELESRINFLLGKMYIEKDQYLKGFNILRDAASMNPDTDIGKEIADYMKTEFKDLLMNDKDLSPLDAVEVFEEFRELTPTGDDGNRLVQKLAERLVQADLLTRASKLLEHQVDYRLEGEDKARVAIRLGAIALIDKDPRTAMKYFATGRDLYDKLLTGDAHDAKLKEIDLLRAKGLSQLNRTEEAIELLNRFPPDPTVNRLRADIAWQAGLWDDAAVAIHDLVLDQAIDPGRPLTAEQADLILNEAVALNLSGNRVELNNTRKRYEEAMKKTQRARLFDIVTRPRKTAILADKETIESIVSEVDMFEDFLKTYRDDAAAASN